MSDIITLLNAAREQAVKGGLPTRRKDAALYALLSGCLFICEKVQREGLEPELQKAVRVSVDERGVGNKGKGRRYAHKSSDAYVLVIRYVMGGTENYATRSRYAKTLREAANRQIRSTELVEWLVKNGGVRTLYLGRAVVTETMSRKTLQLNRPVSFRKGEVFTLQLRYDGKGFFDVVE